ncbi:Pycsar system effector family protein [Pricia sp.]|uniref:Pycsar system effector family protein n=1 Tax=Pricia sp. TaxID=2268138 RepID=UPI003593B1A6
MADLEKPKEKTTSKKPIKRSVKNPHAEELVDHYWGSINYVFGLIKASELKAGLILSFYGILLNLIYQHLGTFFHTGSDQILLLILLGLWLVCTGVSIYFSVRCFMPRIEGKYDKNIFFFGDVISKFGNIQEFSRTFYTISLNEEELFLQLGQQIFIISKIADFKFRNVNRSIRFLALGLFLLLAIAAYHTVLIIT